MSCAFTQKNVKMCKMLLNMGHEVFLYGAEGSDAPCTEFIQTHTLKDIRNAWGEGDNRYEIGYDWKNKQFKHDINEGKKPVTLKYYENTIKYINENKRDDDFLMVTQGFYQKPVSSAVDLFLTIEPGIGYRGSFARFRSFESTYIQYFTYGSEHPRQSINGNYYDRVMPNYFDTKDFEYNPNKKDYYLYIGRMITRKGVWTAIEATKHLGVKLVLAGQSDPEVNINSLPNNVEFIGYADAKKRSKLMGEAIATFTPSLYLEPFCGVHAESMLCGTPVITTNFGAFTDYVINGLNGYRCDTLQDFVDAARKVRKLSPKTVRGYAERFTLGSVSKEYKKWFDDLYRVYESARLPNKRGWSYVE